jgi:hypothetical protein
MPYLSRPGSGLQQSFGPMPFVGGAGNGARAGQGIHRKSYGQLPYLNERNGGDSAASRISSGSLHAYLRALAARLRRTRVVCGDFARVLGPSVTWRHGTTAVFLDPPYDLAQRASVYAVETDAAHRAREWAIENGDNPLLRIALCGYDGEHAMPDGWKPLRWKAAGGYGSQADGRGRENAARECVWFSPHCLNPAELARDAMTRPLAVRDADYTGTLFESEPAHA